MPRYLIEREFGEAEEEAMQRIGERMKHVAKESFPEVVWEHSHVVADETGVKTYCVYAAPDEGQLLRHGEMVREHTILRISEIVGDVTPADFAG